MDTGTVDCLIRDERDVLDVIIGRESMPQGSVDDELLLEAESLAEAAMRLDPPGD